MKTNDFLEELKKLGYNAQVRDIDKQERMVAYSSAADGKIAGMVATQESGMVYLYKETPQEIAVLLTQYAYTPVDERKSGYAGTVASGVKYGLISYNETDGGVVLTFGKTTPNLTIEDAKAANAFIESLDNE